MRTDRRNVVVMLAAAAAAAAATAAVPLRAARADAKIGFLAPGGVALGGNDAVAYFTDGAPLPGLSENGIKWRGAVWYFASPANMQAFEMDPRGFAPRFGGHCAMSLAEGWLRPSDPAQFAVHDRRLFLFSDAGKRALWLADPTANMAAGEAQWRKLAG